MTAQRRSSLGEIALLFFKLGTVAFGGPAAHVAMMEAEVVRKRGWMTRDEFLDLFAATHLIPGPNSTEMAIHIGRMRGGTAGLLVGGACFIVPATVMVLAIAWGYTTYGQMPAVQGLLYGIKPVMIAIVIQALWSLRRSALKSILLAAIAGAVVIGCMIGWHELLLLFGAGLLVPFIRRFGGKANEEAVPGLVAWPVGWWKAAGVAGTGVATTSHAVGLGPLFLFFLKVGSVLFGSGYVLLAFLRADLVERWKWLTESQLLDAIAVGQITPGPVFTTATFIGYLLGGTTGGLLATIGIFLPAFVFVALSAPLIPRMRKSPTFSAFLDGVAAASFALMAVVSWQLFRAAVIDGWTLGLASASGVLLFRFKIDPTWLIVGGMVCGLAVVFFGVAG